MEKFFDYNTELTPQKGDLLISEPFLPDPNFNRTVVLLCEHNEMGSFGFVLNKPSNLKMSEIMEDLGGLEIEAYLGGPVQQDTLHFIHRRPELFENSIEITDGLFWGGEYEKLKLLADTGQINPNEFKFFVGYSGWSGGQLSNELEENSWIISRNIEIEHIFDTKPDKLWKIALEKLGGKYRMFSNYPVDPRLN